MYMKVFICYISVAEYTFEFHTKAIDETIKLIIYWLDAIVQLSI